MFQTLSNRGQSLVRRAQHQHHTSLLETSPEVLRPLSNHTCGVMHVLSTQTTFPMEIAPHLPCKPSNSIQRNDPKWSIISGTHPRTNRWTTRVGSGVITTSLKMTQPITIPSLLERVLRSTCQLGTRQKHSC